MYTGGTTLRTFNRFLRSVFVFGIEATKSGTLALELSESGRIALKFGKLEKPVRSDLFVTLDIVSSRYLGIFELNFVALNALSAEFNVSFRGADGEEVFLQKFRKGRLETGAFRSEEFAAKSVEIDCILDQKIWQFDEPLSCDLYLELLRELAYLFKGKTFEFNYLVKGEAYSAGFHYPNGLVHRISRDWTFLYWEPLLPLEFSGTSEGIEFEGALCFRDPEFEPSFVESYVNFGRTIAHGTHVQSMIEEINAAISEYAAAHYPLDKWEISSKKTFEKLATAIHVRMTKPDFEGSVRESLQSKEVVEPIRDSVARALLNKLEESPEKADRLLRDFRIYDEEWMSRVS